jgi:hypothetical protein
VTQSAQTQPSVNGAHTPSLSQFVGSAQNESASQSAQTQSSAVVHVPSFTHIAWHAGAAVQSAHEHASPASHVMVGVQLAAWQVGVATQSAHEQGSPMSHVPFVVPPVQVGLGPQAGVMAQSAHEQGSPMSHVPFAVPPVQVGLGPQAGVATQSAHAHGSPISHIPSPSQTAPHWGFVAQSAQTQPSLNGSHTPLLSQFMGLEQNGSASQSAQTQSSAVVHVPSVMHIDWHAGAAVQSAHAHPSPASHVMVGVQVAAWQAGVAMQSAHVQGSPISHTRLATPPVQVGLGPQAGVMAQSAHEQGSPISHIPFAVPPVQVGLGPHCGAIAQSAHAHVSPMSHVPSMSQTVAHSGFVAQSAQTQPSVNGAHTPLLLQFPGSEQNGSASQSGQTQSSAVVHVPSVTHIAWQPGAATQSEHEHASPGWHIPFGAPPVQPTAQAGVAAQSAHVQGSPISHIALAVPPMHVGSGPHCGAIAQSAHMHVSPMSHVPSMSQAVAHSGFVAQSAQAQPSVNGAHTPLLLQFPGSEQNGSVSQSGQTQSSAVVHVPSVTHIAWQPGAAVQSAHRHDSPISHMPFVRSPMQSGSATWQAGVAAQSAHVHGSPMSHIALATPPMQVGSGRHCTSMVQSSHAHCSNISQVPFAGPKQFVTHSGLVAQSAQTQPSLNGSHVPSSLQFAGSEQYASVSQSLQTQSSSMVQLPSFMHIDWQPGSTVQSAHAHDSPASQLPSAAPPSHSLAPPPWPPMPPVPPAPPWLMPPSPPSPPLPPSPVPPVPVVISERVVELSEAGSSSLQPASVNMLARDVMAKASSVNRISTPWSD